ncbi:fetuin-B-like [Rhinophrynus dorsalis]
MTHTSSGTPPSPGTLRMEPMKEDSCCGMLDMGKKSGSSRQKSKTPTQDRVAHVRTMNEIEWWISSRWYRDVHNTSLPLKETPLVSIPCNDTGAEAAADLSLRQLNAIRREGFVFGLKRISNVQEQHEEETGTVYYLTLDVLETDCHVLSKRLWKDCPPKSLHEAAFGKCKVTFHINKPRRIARLYNYDCTLNPVARGPFPCRGCPVPKPLNDTHFQEVVQLSIDKFNKESNHNKYFVLGNITRGRKQVVAGTAYHVEFTIQESSCNKTKSPEELSQCQPLDCEFAHSGYCKSFAVSHWSTPDEKHVNVSCSVFEPEAAVVEEQRHQEGHTENKPDHSHQKDHHGKKGDKRGKKHGHSDHKPGHKHDHKHGADHSESHEDEHAHQHMHPHEHHHSSSVDTHCPPPEPDQPIGTITYLALDGEPKPATTDQHVKDRKPPKVA